MFAYISGNVLWVSKESVVVENHGIGYEVFTPTSYIYKETQEVSFYTYFHVREDAMILYGFETKEALKFFELIISVKGVGPRIGLNIMGRVPYSKIVSAIEQADVTFLKTLPGIGPKMASQMVLDLKGKLVTAETVTQLNPKLDEVIETLEALGFKKAEINGVMKKIDNTEENDVQTLIKTALQMLAR